MYQAIKEIIKKSEKKLFVVFIFLLRDVSFSLKTLQNN
jgi:hypothetical protein